ncbi:hypothetical protein VF21_09873 [Pseudogymnoascus sp. 05NY08]|nr:hypothetical protein VF21_09873 [Pseudogymnoascus sp. 05NY08]
MLLGRWSHARLCIKSDASGKTARPDWLLNLSKTPKKMPQQSNGSLNATVQAYSTITFVVDDDAPLASTPPERDEGTLCQHTPAREVGNDTATALDVGIAQGSVVGPAPQQGNNSRATSIAPIDVTSNPVRSPLVHSDSLEQSIQLNTLNQLISDSRRVLTCRTLDKSRNRTDSESTFSHRLVDRQEQTNGVQETGLLRHFRYNLAPWIDVGDPGSFFGIKVMLLATANKSLLAALLALAARHRSLIYPQQNSDDHESSLKFREEAERGLVFEDDHIGHIIRVLLILEVLFCSSPLQWMTLQFHQMGIPDGLTSLAAPGGELSEPLFWLQFKIGIYEPE